MTEDTNVFDNAEEGVKWVSAGMAPSLVAWRGQKDGTGIKHQARRPSARLHLHPFVREGIIDCFFLNQTSRMSDRPNQMIRRQRRPTSARK